MVQARIHSEILPGAQLHALRVLAPLASREGLYLAGGTALALQLGHRRSADLDWFRDGDLDPEALANAFRAGGIAFEVRATARGTLHGTVARVPASFFSYPYPLLEALAVWDDTGCPLASISDIAAMKLAAIAQRGARKDFTDVYAIGKAVMPLGEMLDAFTRKYGTRDIAHVLAALGWFDDAEREPPLAMLWADPWDEIRRAIQSWLKDFAG
jgi:hypothetical protein